MIPSSYRVNGIPTINVYHGGEVVKSIVGARPKAALLKELEDFIHSRSPVPENGGRPEARTSPLAAEVAGHRPAGGGVTTRKTASAASANPRPRPHRR